MADILDVGNASCKHFRCNTSSVHPEPADVVVCRHTSSMCSGIYAQASAHNISDTMELGPELRLATEVIARQENPPHLAAAMRHPVQCRREGMCPGGRPGLQNQWQAAQSRLRWVRLPCLPACHIVHSVEAVVPAPLHRMFPSAAEIMPMEIPLFEEDESLQIERIVLYPYPDLRRIWTRCWVTAVQDARPNLEISVLAPNGVEDNSTFLMALDTQKVETTLHMRQPVPGVTYRVIAELTEGLSTEARVLDRHEFDMVLEFRDAEHHEPGFGFVVDWDESQNADRAQ